jgi:S-DNA-T family DNA segregation ATPase FtsK/SpoIIIE
VASVGDRAGLPEAAELSEKVADKFIEIRALTLFRWKVTGAVLELALVDLVWGRRWFWLAIAAGSVAYAVLGRRDGSPERKAVLAGPRTLTWTTDPQVLVDAFRDAKPIGKGRDAPARRETSRRTVGFRAGSLGYPGVGPVGGTRGCLPSLN